MIGISVSCQPPANHELILHEGVLLQDLEPFSLLGQYNGEVWVACEYDMSNRHDYEKAENLVDDKSKIVWTDEEKGAPPTAALCNFRYA